MAENHQSRCIFLPPQIRSSKLQ